jgi:hypothetical protein
MKHFTLTADHVLLLRNASIDFQDGPEWGGPAIDCKRPFGNGDMVGDMALLLGVNNVETDDEEIHWPPGTRLNMMHLYGELGDALQVVLATGTFSPGDFEADDYSRNWRRVAATVDP